MSSQRGCLVGVVLALLRAASARGDSIVCDTTVAVGDGKITIELWDDVAPKGAARLVELVEDGFFTNLPFFRAIPNFLIQFGISPDAALQNRWAAKGNIEDDPHSQVPFTVRTRLHAQQHFETAGRLCRCILLTVASFATFVPRAPQDGIVSYAGYGKNSRSTVRASNPCA